METLESARAAALEYVAITHDQVQAAPDIVNLAWARTAHMEALNRAEALAEMPEWRFRFGQAREAAASFDVHGTAVAGTLAAMACVTVVTQHTNA